MRKADTTDINLGNEELIVVLSDIHLGCKKDESSENPSFQSFLENLKNNQTFLTAETSQETNELPHVRLVFAGDTFDLWRRDNQEVLHETQHIRTLLEEINEIEHFHVHLIVGNHDYLFQTNQPFQSAFQFYKGLKFTRSDGRVFQILHGDEFDYLQQERFYNRLCQTKGGLGKFWELAPIFLRVAFNDLADPFQFSDEEYEELSHLIQELLTTGKLEANSRIKLNYYFLKLGLEELATFTDKELQYIVELADQPETRFPDLVVDETPIPLDERQARPSPRYVNLLPTMLRSEYPGIVRRALKYAKEEQSVLIFGHTHKPFVLRDEKHQVVIANSGAWLPVTDREQEILNRGRMGRMGTTISNTILVIHNQIVTLYAFKDTGFIEEVDKVTIY